MGAQKITGEITDEMPVVVIQSRRGRRCHERARVGLRSWAQDNVGLVASRQ